MHEGCAVHRGRTPALTRELVDEGRTDEAVSADTALLLEALTRWDAQIWLTLQAKWDLWHALRARGRRPKVKALAKLTAEATN